MDILVDKRTVIYVIAPACTATGGPELLHQLVSSLRNINLNAYMFYLPVGCDNPVHSAYINYDNPFVNNIEDKTHNIIIVPEEFKYIEYLQNYKEIQKVIWWLSVDNFYRSMFEIVNKKSILMRLTNKIVRLLGLPPQYDLVEESLKF